MTLLNFEMKRMRTSLIVWTAAIALLIMVCLIIFPDMEDQVDELNAAFSSMGGFTAAFGMDRLNFGELMGFYGLVVVFVLIGSALKVDLVWNMSDMFNGLMVLPNLIGLLACTVVVRRLTKEYEKNH